MHYLFSPRSRDLPEESHKDETRREDKASVSHYCCNLHCSVFCKLEHYIHSPLIMRSISIEWLTVILITVLMRASTQTLAGCFRAAHHCPSFYTELTSRH